MEAFLQWQEEQAGTEDFERVCSGMTSRRAAADLGTRLPWLWHGGSTGHRGAGSTTVGRPATVLSPLLPLTDNLSVPGPSGGGGRQRCR